MKITSKSRYALKLMMDVAICESKEKHVKRQDIAQRQDIPMEYLDQILIPLRQAGFLESTRGRIGGYHLLRPASEISVWEIFVAVEEHWQPVSCVGEEKSCVLEKVCLAQDAWQIIVDQVEKTLRAIKLNDLCERVEHKHGLSTRDFIHQLANSGSNEELSTRCT